MNKPVYLALSILEISKIVMSEFCYDYMKPKFGKNQICVTWIQTALQSTSKTEGGYSDIPKDIGTKFDTSNYELDRPLPKRKNKKVIGLMNGWLMNDE